MKDRERWGRKYTELICKATLNTSSTVSSFCFIFSPLQSLENWQEKNCMPVSFKAEEKNPFLSELWLYLRMDDFPHFSRRMPVCSAEHTDSWTDSATICGKDRMIIPLFLQVPPFLYNPACLLRRFQLLTSTHGAKQPWCSTQGGTKRCSGLPVLVSLAMHRGICAFSHVSLQVFGYNSAQSLPISGIHDQNLYPNKAWRKRKSLAYFLKSIHLTSVFEFSDCVCFQVLFCIPLLPLPYPFTVRPKHKGQGWPFLALKSENLFIPGYEALGNVLGGEVREEA